jgi:hypothetical protein
VATCRLARFSCARPDPRGCARRPAPPRRAKVSRAWPRADADGRAAAAGAGETRDDADDDQLEAKVVESEIPILKAALDRRVPPPSRRAPHPRVRAHTDRPPQSVCVHTAPEQQRSARRALCAGGPAQFAGRLALTRRGEPQGTLSLSALANAATEEGAQTGLVQSTSMSSLQAADVRAPASAVARACSREVRCTGECAQTRSPAANRTTQVFALGNFVVTIEQNLFRCGRLSQREPRQPQPNAPRLFAQAERGALLGHGGGPSQHRR